MPTPFGEEGVFGGGERYALELANAMAREVDTILVTTGKKRQSLHSGALRVEVYPWMTLVRGLRNNPLSLGFLESLRRVDVIHCVGYGILLTDFSLLFGRLTSKLVFVTDVGGGSDVTLARLLDMTRLARALLLISERACSEFQGGQRARRAIYAGVDTERYRPGPGEREARVLYVGRLLPHKGINYLIEAVDSKTPLIVAGRPYDQRYYRLLRELAAGKDVTFLLAASDEEIIRLYQTSAVCVLPSVEQTVYGSYSSVPELLGFTVLEAMACETPVVCTTVGSLWEVVTDGLNGFLVPPNEPEPLGRQIKVLLEDPRRARDMGARARATIEQRFTWSAVVDRCLAAYTEASKWH